MSNVKISKPRRHIGMLADANTLPVHLIYFNVATT